MRWERLFANIEAQEAAESLRMQEDNIAEMVRLLASEETLQQRLLRRLGQTVAVTTPGRGTVLRMRLTAVGKEWLSGREGSREVLIPLRHVLAVEPDTSEPEQRGADTRVLTVSLRSALRELARQRTLVEVEMAANQVSFRGTFDQIAMDHCVLVQHAADEFRRARAIKTTTWLPLTQLSAVYSWR